jgi:hypothetical protein
MATTGLAGGGTLTGSVVGALLVGATGICNCPGGLLTNPDVDGAPHPAPITNNHGHARIIRLPISDDNAQLAQFIRGSQLRWLLWLVQHHTLCR